LERSEKETPLEDRASLMKSLDEVKLVGEPGTKYEYSNLGYVVLGAIIDRRGKASWEEQVGARVLVPLGVKKWGVGPAEKNDPWPHQTDGPPLPEADPRDNSPIYNSAGRLHMPIADYQRFLAEALRIANGEKALVKPATAKNLMTSPFPVSPHVLGGWIAVRHSFDAKKLALTHDGSNTLNYCTTWIIPRGKLAFCCMANQAGPGQRACEELTRLNLKRFGVEP
jgi:CubicO group peptidase (beta-lactamase class C family)